MPDPRILSLDTETYGKVACRPPQTVFHPRKMLGIDGIPPPQVLTTCAITLPLHDPRDSPSSASSAGSSSFASRTLWPSRSVTPSSTFPLTASELSGLSPGKSMVLQFDGLSPLQSDRNERLLVEWLNHADVLIGQNLVYDLLVLRSRSARLRVALSGRHSIIDLSVLNFLHSELRPEKSLKDLGPVLGTHLYPDDEKERRYPAPSSPALHNYNAQDTHNTILAAVALVRRILAEFPSSPKLSAYCLRFYSDLIWSVVRLSESGVPYSVSRLHALFSSFHRKCRLADSICTSRGLLLDSRDSTRKDVVSTQRSFLSSLLALAPSSPVTLTPKTRELSLTDSNRTILAASLPPSDPRQSTLRAWAIFKSSQKILSTYLYPILLHRRKDPASRSSLLLTPTDPPCPPPPPLEPPAWTAPPKSRTPKRSKKPTSSPSSAPTTPSSSPASDTPPLASAAAPSSSTPPPAASPSTTGGGKLPSRSRPSATTDSPPPSLPASTSTSSTAVTSSPPPPDIYIAYPSWFITPSPFKDSSGSEGGTLQSRITCKDPPEQTAPKIIQSCRRSRSPSGLLISMDLSQIELRVPALLSGEPSLIAAFTAGLDLHTERAIATFTHDWLLGKYPELVGVPFKLWKKVCPAFDALERQVGKRINFADLFRAGADKIRNSVYDDIGIWIPLEVFERAVRNRPIDRPLLWAWQERLIHDAHTDGRLTLPFTGQSRTFLGGDKFDVNEIVNFPVQTIASNVLLCIQHYVSTRLPSLALATSLHPIHLCCNTYDALLLDCSSPAAATEARSILAEAVAHVSTDGYWGLLQSLFSRTVPLSYDIKEVA